MPTCICSLCSHNSALPYRQNWADQSWPPPWPNPGSATEIDAGRKYIFGQNINYFTQVHEFSLNNWIVVWLITIFRELFCFLPLLSYSDSCICVLKMASWMIFSIFEMSKHSIVTVTLNLSAKVDLFVTQCKRKGPFICTRCRYYTGYWWNQRLPVKVSESTFNTRSPVNWYCSRSLHIK